MPATAYFDGLARDLIELELLPVPFNPGLLVWEIWHSKGHKEFQVFADVSLLYLCCWSWGWLKKVAVFVLTGGNTGSESEISAVRVAGFGKVQACEV